MSKYWEIGTIVGVLGIFGMMTYSNIRTNELRAELMLDERIMIEHKNYIAHLEHRPTRSSIITRDLNGNGIPEKFCEIEGKRFFYEVDGKSIEDGLQKPVPKDDGE